MQTYETFTPEEETKLIEAREQGVPYSVLAKQFGRSEKALMNKYFRLMKEGPNKRSERKKEPVITVQFDPNDADTIEYCKETYQSCYDKYRAVRRLAHDFKVKPADIFELLKANGVIGKNSNQPEPKRVNQYYTPEEEKIIVEMRDSGATFPEIGKKIGRDPTSLSMKYKRLKSIEQSKPESTEMKQPVPEVVSEANIIAVDYTEKNSLSQPFDITERKLMGYEVNFSCNGLFFKSLQGVKDFLNEIEMRGCRIEQLKVIEQNSINIKP